VRELSKKSNGVKRVLPSQARRGGVIEEAAAWASRHRGIWGQLTALEKWMKK